MLCQAWGILKENNYKVTLLKIYTNTSLQNGALRGDYNKNSYC